MTKRPPRKSKPSRTRKERFEFYIDASTVETLDNLVKATPELENRSAALRFLARWYDRMSQGKDAAS